MITFDLMKKKKIPWYKWPIRFLLDNCCEYCTNIAVRESNPGKHKYCWNHSDKARNESWTPFGRSDHPIGSTAWRYDPQYNSPFQWLWVKLGIKEKGKPVK